MVVRLPGPVSTPGRPLNAPAVEQPPNGVAAALDRMQARDDAGFIATSLARLGARQMAAFDGAAAETLKPDTLLAGAPAPAFAGRFLDQFDADVESVIGEAAGRDGVKPSAHAFDLFRRRAQGLRDGFAERGALHEDFLHRQSLAQSAGLAVDELGELAGRAPEMLGETLSGLDDIVAAHAGVLEPEAADGLRREGRAMLASAAVDGLISRDADGALAALDDGVFNADLDPAAKAGLRDRAERLRDARAADRDIADRRAAAAAADETARASLTFLSGYRRRLDSGEATLAELADAETSGAITPAQVFKLHAAFDEATAQREAEQRQIARVSDALADGSVLDPADPETHAAVELHFRTVAGPMLDGLDAEGIAAGLTDYVEQTGVAPDAVLKQLQGQVLAGEPEEQVRAASTLATLKGIDPTVRDRAQPDARDRAGRINEFSRLGIPADRVVESVDRRDTASAREPTLSQADGSARPGPSRDLSSKEKAVLVDALVAAGVPPDVAARQAEKPAFGEDDIIPADDPVEARAQRIVFFLAPAIPFIASGAITGVEALLPALVLLGTMFALKGDTPEVEQGAGNGQAGDGQSNEDSARTNDPGQKADPAKRIVPVEDLPTGTPPFPPEPPKFPDRTEFPADPPKFPDRTEFPADPPKIPEDTEFPVPIDPGMLIHVNPDQSDEFNLPLIVESRGNERTQNLNTDVREVGEEIANEYGLSATHTGGARDDKGVDKTETYLANRQTRERKGSSRTDLTFTSGKTGRRLFVNSTDTKADKVTPSAREHRAAVRIVMNGETGDILVLVPKLGDGETLDRESLKEFLRPLLSEVDKPVLDVDPRDSTAPEKLWRQWYPRN